MVRGDRIYNLRTARGYTLQELGDKVGVGTSTVHKWETGQIETIRSDKINKLAHALDVTPGYLLDWTDRPLAYDGPSLDTAQNEETHDEDLLQSSVDDILRGGNGLKTLGQRIFWLRKSLRMTQEELASKVGVSRVTINKYETGHAKALKPMMLEALTTALETSPDFLLGKTDDAGRPLTLNDNASKAKTLQESMAGRQHPIDEMAYTATGNLDEVLEVNPEEENPYRRIITERQLREEERELLRIYRELDLRRRVDLLHYAFELSSQKRREERT